MDNSVNILLLEDDFNDAELIHCQVVKSGLDFNWMHVTNLITFVETLHNSIPDLILSDYNLIGFTGIDALEIVKQKCPFVPFIVVTGALDEETAVETIKAGAWDYVVKDRLTRLNLAIKNALELKKEKAAKILALNNLKKSEERFTLAIDGTMEGIWDYNIETSESFCSPRFKSLLGYKDHEINLYKSWIEMLHPDDKALTLEMLRQHLSARLPHFQAEFKMKCKNGSYKWILSRAKALFDKNGKAIRITGSIKDISERKEKEIELILAKEKAEESNRLKIEFIHNLSHEIRTPMNTILGFTNLMNKPDLSVNSKTKYIQIINNSTYRLLNTINDILDISKIESNQLELKIENIPFRSTLDLLIETHTNSNLYNSKPEIQLRWKFSEYMTKWYLKTDPFRFKQIFDELIENSLKFTNQGYVEIGGRLVHSNYADEILFYVKDTGIGIEDSDKDIIFERLRQTNDKMFKEGMGLGLSIAKALVELLGGKIWFESKINIGTIFYFSFPFNENKLDEVNQLVTKELSY